MKNEIEPLELTVSPSFGLLVCLLNFLIGGFCIMLIDISNPKFTLLHLICFLCASLVCVIYFCKYFYYLITGKVLLKIDRDEISDFRSVTILKNCVDTIKWKDVLSIIPSSASLMAGVPARTVTLHLVLRESGFKIIPLSDLNMNNEVLLNLINDKYKPGYVRGF